MVSAFVLTTNAFSHEVIQNASGMWEMRTEHMTLITDVKIDDELQTWPELLEQAKAQLQSYFKPVSLKLENLHATVHLIGNRNRWEQLGLLKHIPAFDDGYQLHSHLYLVEQPTVYFRRVVFLHETTHWIIATCLGGNGSPLYMEGAAEMFSMHKLVHQSQFTPRLFGPQPNLQLTLDAIPSFPSDAPGWNRFRLIDDSLRIGNAPTLDEILNYRSMMPNRMTRYGWGWAACVFLSKHPAYGIILKEETSKGLDYSLKLSDQLRSKLASDWESIVIDWNTFLTEFDYGFDLKRSFFSCRDVTRDVLKTGKVRSMELKSDIGYQSTGVVVEQGQTIQIAAIGTMMLRRGKAGLDWTAEPQGITIQYHKNAPLGCVLAVLAPLDTSLATKRWVPTKIGRQKEMIASVRSLLLLKVNEPSHELHDNVGVFQVEITGVTK